MRVSIIALGSRGDVQPCVALGRGLRDAGHEVRIAADPLFESLIAAHGIEFARVSGDALRLAQGDLGRKVLEGQMSFFSRLPALARTIGTTVHQRFEDSWRACQEADVVLVTPVAVTLGYSIAQKLGRPLVSIFFAPLTPPLTSAAHRFLLRWAQRLAGLVLWSVFRPATNQARRNVLGLPPLPFLSPVADADRHRFPVLCAYSTHVFPRPADLRSWWHITGYWFGADDNKWQPPQDLIDFLAAGPPPVYVGFGSMTTRSPGETTELISTALVRAGQRGILATGWGGLQDGVRSESVYSISNVPHEWLFPRVAAVVHHGGAGTTAAGLRAGRPTVILPFSVADQPMWGRRVHELGVGPPPIHQKRLSVESLAHALRIASGDETMRRRAGELGERIRSEDGVTRAVEILEDLGKAIMTGSRTLPISRTY